MNEKKESNTLGIIKFLTETTEEAKKYLSGYYEVISSGKLGDNEFQVKQTLVDHRLMIDFPDKRYVVSLWDIMHMITDLRENEGTIDIESVIKAWVKAEKNHNPPADEKGIKTAMERLTKLAIREFKNV